MTARNNRRPLRALSVTLIAMFCSLTLSAAPPETKEAKTDQSAVPVAAPAAPAAEPVRSAVAYPLELLQNVQDGTGLSVAEFDSYYAILAHAKKIPLAKQRTAADEVLKRHEAAFKANPKNRRLKYSLIRDLIAHRDEWRGEPITIRGYIRDLKDFEPEGNTQGLKTLHQCYLWTKDSEGNPYAIVVSDVPANMPKVSRRETLDHVEVTGYLFKFWMYKADNEPGRWVAPLILASKLEWTPAVEKPPFLTSTQFAILIVGLVTVGFGAWWYSGVQSAKIRAARREQQFEPLANDPL